MLSRTYINLTHDEEITVLVALRQAGARKIEYGEKASKAGRDDIAKRWYSEATAIEALYTKLAASEHMAYSMLGEDGD